MVCTLIVLFSSYLLHHMTSVHTSHDICRELSKYQREGSFPEKKGYKPNVRIVHVDDSGRELSIKEVLLHPLISVHTLSLHIESLYTTSQKTFCATSPYPTSCFVIYENYTRATDMHAGITTSACVFGLDVITAINALNL